MRDVVTGFYVNVLNKLIKNSTISRSDSVLIVCGGPLDEKVMGLVGFSDFTVTNVDDGISNTRQDAENLSYNDKSFDLVIVHAGLHHCYSPHRALLEMYRVARKCVVAFESRDSLLARTAVKLGLTLDYEVNSITSDGRGGVANTCIPNFIYRWTEREVIKTISSFDPMHSPRAQFFYDMRLPIQRFSESGWTFVRKAALLLEPLSSLLARIFPKQCNEFGFAILKQEALQPWLERYDDGSARLARGYIPGAWRVYS